MTFLIPYIAAITLLAPASRCPLPEKAAEAHRVFTNADLDLMASCRYETGALSEPASGPTGARPPKGRGLTRASALSQAGQGDLEAEWHARWRAIDQKIRRLRREAQELRQEAAEAARDVKKRPAGRRSPSLLINRARALEAEAKELEDEFQARARREGALPGWLRPDVR